jgi:D-Tyr-tRNAtyr deacylase
VSALGDKCEDKHKGKRKNLMDGTRSGRASTVMFLEVKEKIDQRVRDNLTITTDVFASEMSVSYGTNGARMT